MSQVIFGFGIFLGSFPIFLAKLFWALEFFLALFQCFLLRIFILYYFSWLFQQRILQLLSFSLFSSLILPIRMLMTSRYANIKRHINIKPYTVTKRHIIRRHMHIKNALQRAFILFAGHLPSLYCCNRHSLFTRRSRYLPWPHQDILSRLPRHPFRLCFPL